MTLDLSIIVPAYNESERIDGTLRLIHQYLQGRKYTYEILVVNDGSTDGTSEVVTRLTESIASIRLITLHNNQGKGRAVKIGMLAAKGEARLFMDADGSTSITELSELMPALQEGYEIVVGSRLVPGAVKEVHQNVFREFLGWTYRRLVHALLPISVLDTQNGFKLFSGTAAEVIFSKVQTARWGFDVELLVIAQQLSFRVKEVPIVWRNNAESKMSFLQMPGMLLDLIRIRLTYRV